MFQTDGSLPNGVCFRVEGRVNAPDFFDQLKRVEGPEGAMFLRGQETVSQFPDELDLTFDIHDESCDPRFHSTGRPVYLTGEMMSKMRLNLYWKHGVDLRPLKIIKEPHASVEEIEPFAKSLTAELPKRFEWIYDMAVSGAGVPLSDSLVLVFRTANERIAARVAARL